MITRIIIEHFKSIEHCDLTLGPVNIFVGPNGSGKSNIIDAISFLKDAIEHDLDHAFRERLGFESVRQWSGGKSHEIRLELHFESKTGKSTYSIAIDGQEDEYFVRHEEMFVYKKLNNSQLLTIGHLTRDNYERDKHNNLRARYKLIDEDGANNAFSDKESAHPQELFANEVFVGSAVNAFSSELDDFFSQVEIYNISAEKLRRPSEHSGEVRLRRDGGNIYSIILGAIGRKFDRKFKQNIVHGLSSVAPALCDIEIMEVGGFCIPLFRPLSVPKQSKPSFQSRFNIVQVSDGTLRALGLLTALYHPDRPGMIALEEPEQILHPGALAVLAEAIKESSEQSQIFITTHSPDLLDHFDPESVFAVEMVDGVTKVAGVSEGQMASVREGLFTLGEIMSMEGVMRASPPPPDTATGTDDA